MLIVPLGSTEQHGPHLPVETDTIIATAWANGVARRMGATVAPALPYGSAGEHQAFRGTLSIGQEALEINIIELARSAQTHHDSVAFLSGHGGNAQPLASAIRQLRAERHVVWGLVPWLSNADAHAGFTETSIMLYVAPDLVRMDLAEPGNTTAVEELLGQMRATGLASVTPNGVLGDPAGATGERGRQYLEELVDYAVAELER